MPNNFGICYSIVLLSEWYRHQMLKLLMFFFFKLFSLISTDLCVCVWFSSLPLTLTFSHASSLSTSPTFPLCPPCHATDSHVIWISKLRSLSLDWCGSLGQYRAIVLGCAPFFMWLWGGLFWLLLWGFFFWVVVGLF